MSVPTDKIERIEGPTKAGPRRRPRWILSLVLTDEHAAHGLAAYLTSGAAAGPTSGSPLVTWIIGDAGHDQLPPQDEPLIIDEVVSRVRPGAVGRPARRGDPGAAL